MKGYIFEYLDEYDYSSKERTLRKYNKLAHKKLVFDYYPELKSGNFLGELVSTANNTSNYELKIETDKMFEKVHGEIKLHYTVYHDKNIILLTNITPEDILNEAYSRELDTYKGVIVSKSNPGKDIFKVNLLSKVGK